MSLGQKIAIGVGTLVAFIGLVILLALYATSGITDVIKDQLAALRAGDVPKAYTYTSKDFQGITSLNDFVQFVNHYPSLKKNKTIDIKAREINDGIGTVKAILHGQSGAVTPIEYRLVKENEKWKILGIVINPVGMMVEGQTAKDNTPTNVTATGSAALTQSYDNKDSRYTIKYPKDWVYDASTRGTVVFSGQRGTPSYFSTVNVQTILSKKNGGQFSTVKDFIVDLKKQATGLSNTLAYVDGGPIEITQLDGKKARGEFLTFTYRYEGHQFKQWQIVVLRNDEQVFYAWAYTSPVEEYDQDLPIAKEMLKSFSIY